MTKIEHMRLYRSHLANETVKLVEEFIARGETKEAGVVLSARVDMLHQRERLLNAEIDKLEAINYGLRSAQHEVPLEFQTA
jgi:hypothetical protein